MVKFHRALSAVCLSVLVLQTGRVCHAGPAKQPGTAEIVNVDLVDSYSKAKHHGQDSSKDAAANCGGSFTGGINFRIVCNSNGEDICTTLTELSSEVAELRESFSSLQQYVRTLESKPPMPGPPGRRGARGERGESGPRGTKGNVGAPGEPGVQGMTGLEGDAGVPGAAGATGAKGSQ